MELLRTQNVSFQYENPEELPLSVLRDVSLTVRRGEFLAVLGHNGSGKSTLAKHFNAMLLPTTGAVWVENLSTADESHWLDIRRTVGMVLQNPDNQLVSTIVEEDVAFGPENLGVEPSEIAVRVNEALRLVDMLDYRDHAVHKLSGGQKQRVAIAGVLAMHPDCLVLDEPTAMLDPKGRREVMDTVRRLNRENGMTVVLITHYMEEAAMADRVLVMEEGEIVREGAPSEVFSQVEQLRAVQLDVPQPTELCYELRRRGVQLPPDVLTVEQAVEALAAEWEGSL
ncbi:MAG: energy-coupling factor transporter ATPase [Clostridia bacterium]|nr:energy-coupling factor transporter ATPase [Clostridia bacterium]